MSVKKMTEVTQVMDWWNSLSEYHQQAIARMRHEAFKPKDMTSKMIMSELKRMRKLVDKYKTLIVDDGEITNNKNNNK